MSVQIMKPGEVALVQVPASWDARQIRLEQGRVRRHTEKYEIPVHVVIVGGGQGSNAEAAEFLSAFSPGTVEVPDENVRESAVA